MLKIDELNHVKISRKIMRCLSDYRSVSSTTSQDQFQKIALGRRLKKQNDRLKGSLGRVLFAAELEFPKILATEGYLNIHILHEYAEMLELSKQLYY